jgi:LacI family transcriptional regulator
MANTTIYDVAGAAKVSLATVSRVMNNPEKVNPETRERVLKVIQKLGYKPNAIARGLASRKTTTVGVIMADVSRAASAAQLGGIIDIAKQYEYSIKLFSIMENDDIKETIRAVVAEQVDGILFLNDELLQEQIDIVLSHIRDAQIPLVLCNVLYDNEEIPTVSIDYEESTYQVTMDLINRGREHVYFFTTARNYTVNQHKEQGYIRACEETGRAPLILRTSGNVSINRLHFEEFFNDKPVDGVIAVRDSIACSFMNYAFESGLDCPRDVSIIGLQNTKYAILSRPNLTCVDTPVYDIGAVSMRLLTKFMKQEPVDNIKVILPHSVMKRKSD